MQPRPRRCATLLVLLVLLAAYAFAGDDDDKPVPRFRAKTMAGESFNNESVKGKVVLLEILDHLMPVLSPGRVARRGHQPGIRQQGTDRFGH